MRSEVTIDPSIGKSAFYKGGRRRRSSELGNERQRKVLGRVLGTGRAGWVMGCAENGGLRKWGPAWALRQRRGNIPVPDGGETGPATLAFLL